MADGKRIRIDVDYGIRDIDIVLFGLDGSRMISDDKYTVLFSNLRTQDGAIAMNVGDRTTGLDIDLDALPDRIERLMLVASHDTQPLSSARPLAVTIGTASFDAGPVLGQERAVMLLELYRHGGAWRVWAIGQGFEQGLAKLIEHLGGSVSGEPEQAATSRPVAAPAPDPTPTGQTGGVSLSKVTLEKRRTISLEKTGSDFGDIVLNLNWAARKGMFGGASIDLDLGCLYELEDGSKGVVQALGHAFGVYDSAPFIELDGDDRTGSSTAGETIRINGRRFDRIRRIAVFALIYEGAVRWDQTDARASIRMPGQPEIVVEIRNGGDRHRLYGMAVIENERGTMRITNHAAGYRDQKEFAEQIGIHLRWSVGRKD